MDTFTFPGAEKCHTVRGILLFKNSSLFHKAFIPLKHFLLHTASISRTSPFFLSFLPISFHIQTSFMGCSTEIKANILYTTTSTSVNHISLFILPTICRFYEVPSIHLFCAFDERVFDSFPLFLSEA